MRNGYGQEEFSSGRTETGKNASGWADGIYPIGGTSFSISGQFSYEPESYSSSGTTITGYDATFSDTTWFDRIDETSPICMGPEPEKQEISLTTDYTLETAALPWNEITELVTEKIQEKEIEAMSKRKEIKIEDTRMHQFDNVDRPMHYAAGTIECIDAIEAQLSAEEFRGYLKGNVIKYLWREKHKGGVESLKKANWYLNKIIP